MQTRTFWPGPQGTTQATEFLWAKAEIFGRVALEADVKPEMGEASLRFGLRGVAGGQG